METGARGASRGGSEWTLVRLAPSPFHFSSLNAQAYRRHHGTTQESRTACGSGVTVHSPAVAGKSKVWPNVSLDPVRGSLPACSTIAAPSRHMTIVKRLARPRAIGALSLHRSSAKYGHEDSRSRRLPCGSWLRIGNHQAHRPAREIDRFQGLSNVELAGLTVGANASPVIHPEGRVGHLLDLGQQDPRTDRVDRSGVYHDAVAGPGRKTVQEGLNLPGCNGFGELLASDPLIEPRVDQTARFGRDDDPGLGLAAVVGQAPALLIIGMHLDREDSRASMNFTSSGNGRATIQLRTQELTPSVLDQVAEARPGHRHLRKPCSPRHDNRRSPSFRRNRYLLRSACAETFPAADRPRSAGAGSARNGGDRETDSHHRPPSYCDVRHDDITKGLLPAGPRIRSHANQGCRRHRGHECFRRWCLNVCAAQSAREAYWKSLFRSCYDFTERNAPARPAVPARPTSGAASKGSGLGTGRRDPRLLHNPPSPAISTAPFGWSTSMPSDRDLFLEEQQMVTMSFGEHIEELRVRLILALIGLVVGVIVAFIPPLDLGRRVMESMEAPGQDSASTLLRGRVRQDGPGGRGGQGGLSHDDGLDSGRRIC